MGAQDRHDPHHPEEGAFQIRDRRLRFSEGPVSSPVEPPPAPPGDTDPASATPPPQDDGPVTFSSFLLSMAASALNLLQDRSSLAHARQIIDTLGLLQEKTKGNLTGEEEGLLSQVLYSLRMHFVEVQKKQSG